MRTALAAIVSVLAAGSAVAQVAIPRVSPGASVSQKIGTTEIRVDYHRPQVKGRTIWGDLVPWDAVWRLGANDATKLTFSDPVRIAGKEVAAGSYALFAIPRDREPGPEAVPRVHGRARDDALGAGESRPTGSSPGGRARTVPE